MARTLDQKLSERLKQLALIDNKPGASARLGAQLVAKAKARPLSAVREHLALGQPETVQQPEVRPYQELHTDCPHG